MCSLDFDLSLCLLSGKSNFSSRDPKSTTDNQTMPRQAMNIEFCRLWLSNNNCASADEFEVERFDIRDSHSVSYKREKNMEPQLLNVNNHFVPNQFISDGFHGKLLVGLLVQYKKQ